MNTEREDVIQVRIFQMPSEERDHAWISVQELREAGLSPDAGRYRQVLETKMEPGESMADLYDRLHYGRPVEGMQRLQVSDVLMFDRGGKRTSYYVDPFGFKPVPEMTAPLLEHNRMQIQHHVQKRSAR